MKKSFPRIAIFVLLFLFGCAEPAKSECQRLGDAFDAVVPLSEPNLCVQDLSYFAQPPVIGGTLTGIVSEYINQNESEGINFYVLKLNGTKRTGEILLRPLNISAGAANTSVAKPLPYRVGRFYRFALQCASSYSAMNSGIFTGAAFEEMDCA